MFPALFRHLTLPTALVGAFVFGFSAFSGSILGSAVAPSPAQLNSQNNTWSWGLPTNPPPRRTDYVKLSKSWTYATNIPAGYPCADYVLGPGTPAPGRVLARGNFRRCAGF